MRPKSHISNNYPELKGFCDNAPIHRNRVCTNIWECAQNFNWAKLLPLCDENCVWSNACRKNSYSQCRCSRAHSKSANSPISSRSQRCYSAFNQAASAANLDALTQREEWSGWGRRRLRSNRVSWRRIFITWHRHLNQLTEANNEAMRVKRGSLARSQGARVFYSSQHMHAR